MITYVAARPLCPLFDRPDEGAERVDELLSGWPVDRPEACSGSWWKVRTHYGYTGWLPRAWLVPDNGWSAAPRLVVTALFADLLSGPEVERPVLATLPRGALVRPLPGPCPDGWQQVLLPDGQKGYTKRNFLAEYSVSPPLLPEEQLRAQVVARAKSYLGVQYRWGGKSPMGIDCSGLTFMSWFFSGVLLYRDAKLVPGYLARPIPPEQCRPADLLYFPGHIALYLGEGRYIHSTARAGSDGVVINSLDPTHPDYRPDLPDKLLTGGTVFPLSPPDLTTL